MLRLSVIIPSFNRRRMLAQAITSAPCQEPSIDEVIIVDDASTDDTRAYCEAFKVQQSATRIIYHRNQLNRGAQFSRNCGFALASGEVVMFLDSDDVLVENGVEALRNALEKDGCLDYAYGKVIKTGPDLNPLLGTRPIGAPFYHAPVELAGYHWHTPAALYRRNYLARIGPWNEELTGSQDWEFQARVKLGGGKWRFLDHTIALCRQHEGARVGTSKFRPHYVQSVERACLSLASHASAAGMLDAALRRRLARKLYLHALEFSLNGFANARKRLINEAAELVSGDPLYGEFLRIARLMPRLIDRIFWTASQRMIRCRSALEDCLISLELLPNHG